MRLSDIFTLPVTLSKVMSAILLFLDLTVVMVRLSAWRSLYALKVKVGLPLFLYSISMIDPESITSSASESIEKDVVACPPPD